jgi:hypothetical protein
MDNQPYYDEYMYYKNKNNDLRSLMDGSLYDQIYNDENNNLYLLFITSNLLEKEHIRISSQIEMEPVVAKKRNMTYREQDDTEPRIKKAKTYPDYIYNLTPFLKQYVTPHKLPQFEADLNYDKILVDKLESMVEDDEYINHENYGKTVECINPDHLFDHGVKFFQIKASSGNFMGSSNSSIVTPYFSLHDRTIHTGSYKYGKTIHDISIFDGDFIKKILVGYICIDFVKRDKYLTINKSRSFFVLPKTKIDNTIKELFTQDFTEMFIEHNEVSYNYYSYIDIVHPTIIFDDKNNDVVTFSERYEHVLHIPLDYLLITKLTILENPLKIQL